MKIIFPIILVVLSSLLFGCASNEDAATSQDEAAETGAAERDNRTAFEGKTGSGLLMERYQTGEIGGFRD